MQKQENKKEVTNREYKSSAFTTYFGTPERAAELYCALDQNAQVGPEDITFETLSGVLYMARKNDMAFKILRLSDSYLEKVKDPMLELKVKMININLSADHPILQKSRSVYEYSWFVQRVQEYMKNGWMRDEAMVKTICDCLDAGIMVDFIEEHGSEVQNMIFTEFNLEDAKQVWKDEAQIEGIIFAYAELGRTKEECLKTLMEKFSHFFIKEELVWMIDKHWDRKEE